VSVVKGSSRTRKRAPEQHRRGHRTGRGARREAHQHGGTSTQGGLSHPPTIQKGGGSACLRGTNHGMSINQSVKGPHKATHGTHGLKQKRMKPQATSQRTTTGLQGGQEAGSDAGLGGCERVTTALVCETRAFSITPFIFQWRALKLMDVTSAGLSSPGGRRRCPGMLSRTMWRLRQAGALAWHCGPVRAARVNARVLEPLNLYIHIQRGRP